MVDNVNKSAFNANAVAAQLGAHLASDDLTPPQLSAGVESRSVLRTFANTAQSIGRAVFGNAWDMLTKQQQKAFEITTLAWDNPIAYNDMATKVAFSNESRLVNTPGVDSYLVPTLTDGLEAYDHRNLVNSKIATSVINVGSARQDDFAEMFYETVVLSPDEGNVTVTIEQTYVMNDYLHTGNGFGGVPYGFGSVNLIDASINPSVLRSNAIKAIPLYAASNECFTQDVAPFMADGNIETGALKFNTAIDLLAISMDDLLNPNAVADSTDQLDHALSIDTIYLKLKKGGDEEIIPIKLKDVPGANFVPNPLGKTASRDVVLNFTTDSIPLHGKMLTVAGTESTILEYLRDPARENWVAYLDFSLSGTSNLETGNIRVNDSVVQIASVWDTQVNAKGMANPTKVANPADVNALVSHFDEIKLVGWFPDAQRTNINRRTRGLLIRTDILSETYTIPMGPPISVLTPVVDTETLVDMEGPIRTNRILNSQNALKTLIEYGDSLKRHINSVDVYSPRPEVQGIGRYIMRTYFDEVEIDALQVVDSLRSTERLEDLNYAIINVLRSRVAQAYANSNYGPAWQALGIEGKPVVNIGTTLEIAQYLNLRADTAILGQMFDYEFATTTNRELEDMIIVNFTTKTDHTFLKSGNFYYIPEMVSTLPKTTNNAQSVQLTVQNRNKHINHCPVQIRIHVKNLAQALSSKVPVKTLTTLVEAEGAAPAAGAAGAAGAGAGAPANGAVGP